MADFSKAWGLFGSAFILAVEETGSAIAEATHEGFAYLAEKTKPEEKTVAAPEAEKDQSVK